jgi:hypothetical protein
LAFKEKGSVILKKLGIYLAVLLFVAGIWAVSEFMIPRKNEGLKPVPFFTNLQADKIKEIQWLRGTEIVHLKKNKTWEIIQPISMPADPVITNNILRTLSTLTPEKRFSVSGQDQQEFGLDSPRLKIKFLTEGKWFDIQIGKKTPVGFDSYIKVSNSPDLFLVQEIFVRELDQELSALKEKKVKEGP